MVDSNSEKQLLALVVGGDGDDFVRQAMGKLENHEVRVHRCGNVYSAAAKLAAEGGRSDVLVVGRLERLAVEGGRFLEMVAEKGFFCCCYDPKNLAKNKKYAHLSGLPGRGVFFIERGDQVVQAVGEILAGQWVLLAESKGKGSSSFMKEEYLTTQAELDALLGM